MQMSNGILLPDYEKSILNLITSVLKKFNVESDYSELKELKKVMAKEYKNIVMIILDGMGENVLEHISPNGLFEKNKLCNVTSVFPSTTTAAMTTYYSGKLPIETGWIAWTQYFKEYGKYINVLAEEDDLTGEKLKTSDLKLSDIIGYKNIYEKILENNDDVQVVEIMPEYCNKRTKLTLSANNIDEVCYGISTICSSNKNKQFVFAYCDNPDSILHKNGCCSDEAKEFILMTEKRVEQLVNELRGTNTLLIISADHGHNDIKEKISIMDMPEIQECLIMPPSLESRTISFNVKENRKDDFEKEFKKKFDGKYILYNKEEFLKTGLMGNKKEHRKIDDFIGNYVAIAISDTIIALENYSNKERKRASEKKSTHCGLTRNEMEVPVIVFEI